MNKFVKFLFLLFIFAISSCASFENKQNLSRKPSGDPIDRGGTRIGNGGGGCVCRNDGKIQESILLDFIEAKPKYGIDILNSNLAEYDQIAKSISNLDKNLFVKKIISDELERQKKIITDISDMEILPETKDFSSYICPERSGLSCKFEQIASFNDYENKLNLKRSIFEKLSKTHKAGLLLHEAIYKVDRSFFKDLNITSDFTKKLVALLFAKNPDKNKINEEISSHFKYHNAGFSMTGSGGRHWYNFVYKNAVNEYINIFDVEFDDVDYSKKPYYTAFTKNKKYIVNGINGQHLIFDKNTETEILMNGTVKIGPSSNFKILDFAGNEVSNIKNEVNLEAINSYSAEAGAKSFFYKENNLYGLKDINNNVTLPPSFQKINNFVLYKILKAKYASVGVEIDGKIVYGIIKDNGDWLYKPFSKLPIEFTDIAFKYLGYKSNKYGYYSLENKLIAYPRFDLVTDFNKGHGIATLNECFYGMAFFESCRIPRNEENIENENKLVSKIKYDREGNIKGSSTNFAANSVFFINKNKSVPRIYYGANTKFEWINPINVDEQNEIVTEDRSCENGGPAVLISVDKKHADHVPLSIHHGYSVLFDPWYFPEPFYRNSNYMKHEEKNSKLKRYAYILGVNGSVKKYSIKTVQSCNDNTLTMQLKDGTKYILNEYGDFIIKDFDDSEAFSEGLAAIKIKKKWGFINKKGEFVISPNFDRVETFFTEGKAIVVVDGRRIQINSKGEILGYQ